EAIGHHPHQLTFRPEPFEEQYELQLEEHHRVNGRTSGTSVLVGDPVADEAEVHLRIQVPVEIVGRNQLLEADLWVRNERPPFGSNHGPPPCPVTGSQ